MGPSASAAITRAPNPSAPAATPGSGPITPLARHSPGREIGARSRTGVTGASRPNTSRPGPPDERAIPSTDGTVDSAPRKRASLLANSPIASASRARRSGSAT